MREHFTLVTGWQMYEKMDDVGVRIKKELSTSITGCPYEINLEIVFTQEELEKMGIDVDDEDRAAYELDMNVTYKEMEVNSLMWEYINTVKKVMEENDTDSWRVTEWDEHCPFLFECDPNYEDPEEALQEKRETWV